MAAQKKDPEKSNDLFARLQTLELKELQSNELVQKIIENERDRCLEFDLGGEPIRVAAAFPREIRYFYESQKKRPKDTPIEFKDVERDGYMVMSKLCLDAPFNTEAFWEYYDTMTGKFWGVFNSIYAGIEKNEERIGEFRQK
jgi:hypothetical protein